MSNLPDDWNSHRFRCPECGGWNHKSGAEACDCNGSDEPPDELAAHMLRRAIEVLGGIEPLDYKVPIARALIDDALALLRLSASDEHAALLYGRLTDDR